MNNITQLTGATSVLGSLKFAAAKLDYYRPQK
jgi:hypothetical protein